MTKRAILIEIRDAIESATSPLQLAGKLDALLPEIVTEIAAEAKIKRRRRKHIADLAELALHSLQCPNGNCIDLCIEEFERVRVKNSPKQGPGH